MVAEVKGSTSGVVSPTVQRPAPNEAATAAAATASAKPNGDSVHFTSTASELQQLEKAVKAAPDIDVERVNEIRNAIAEGSYQVDNEKLAESLIRHDMMMMGAGGAGKK